MASCFVAVHALESHPRLFLTQSKLDSLRDAVAEPGTHHFAAFNAMKARVDKNDLDIYIMSMNYARVFRAREAALISLLSGEDRYSDTAFQLLAAVVTEPDPSNARQPDSGYGLGRGVTGFNFALVYDWLYNTWTPQQRDYIRSVIVRSIGEWTELERNENGEVDFHGNHLWEPYQSNWVPVCTGAQITMMLSVYLENSTETGNFYQEPLTGYSDRYDHLKEILLKHIQATYGNLGLTNEGMDYAEFAGQILVPTVIAMADAGDRDLFDTCQTRQWWKWLEYAVPSSARWGAHMQSGVDGGWLFTNGWSSALFGLIPPSEQDVYRHCYDLFCGTKSPLPDSLSFDCNFGGTAFSIIMYPMSPFHGLPEAWRPSMVGDTGHGNFYFRNRFSGPDDILFSVYGDKWWNKGTWNQAEALDIRLFAYETRFFGGPGKTKDMKNYSSLLVDGNAWGSKVPGKKNVNGIGGYRHSTLAQNGGYVIVEGGEQYELIGCDSVFRHCSVGFGTDRHTIAVLDQVYSTQHHSYDWQLNPGNEDNSDGIMVTTGTEDQRPYFILHGRDDGYVKGWVLYPEIVEMPTANRDAVAPFKIGTEGEEQQIFIVMEVGKGIPSEAAFEGGGLSRKITFGENTVSYDAATNRILGASDEVAARQFRADVVVDKRNLSARYAGHGRGFIIDIPSSFVGGQLTLVDARGALIASDRVYAGAQVSLHTGNSALAPGMYYVVLNKENVRQVQSVLVSGR